MSLDRIRQLNDQFRKMVAQDYPDNVIETYPVVKLSWSELQDIFERISSFSDFDDTVGPEHDFFSFDYKGRRYAVKINYFAGDLTHPSPDPSDPDRTVRVMTIIA